MLKVTYYGNLNDHAITEYLTVLHDGYAGYKAMERLKMISGKVGVDYMVQESLEALCVELGRSSAPTSIAFTKKGKFYEIVDRIWGVREFVFDESEDILF
jgi:DNA repair protein RadD